MVGQFLTLLLIFFFVLRTIRVVLLYTELWQRKEYRLDRIESHLKTWSGKRLLFHPLVITRLILLSLFPLFFYFNLSFSYFILTTFYFSVEGVLSLYHLTGKAWKIPQWGNRTFTVFLTSLTLLLVFLITMPLNLPLLLLGIANFTPFLVSSLFILSNIPFAIHERILVSKAMSKLSEVSPIIIGITGSFGKTSTKEFLYQMLATKFKVCKTAKSQNALIAVAETLLNKVNNKTQIFVVEMGAYKRGEIDRICKLVKPEIAIVAGINEQHLELFGSIENTMKAKYELVDNLTTDGTAIFNNGNKYCRIMARWAKNEKKRVILYNDGYSVSDVKVGRRKTEFTLSLAGKKKKTETKILGEHQLDNILAASVASFNLGMTISEIAESIRKLQPPLATMLLVKTRGRCTFIDDTYNSNPDGVLAALRYMKLYSGYRVLILQPLIELGEREDDINLKLGEEVGKVCDLVFLTNKTNYSPFANGFKKSKNSLACLKFVSRKTYDTLLKSAGRNDIVLFEGREAGTVLKNLKLNFAI